MIDKKGMKKCSKCKKKKHYSFFHKHKGEKDGYDCQCKICKNLATKIATHKNPEKYREKSKTYYKTHPDKVKEYRNKNKRHLYNWRIKKTYGISVEEVDSLLKTQNYKCAICYGDNKSKPLHIDHNHKTGKVRGLLCQSCNITLVAVLEHPLYKKALEYLKKHD